MSFTVIKQKLSLLTHYNRVIFVTGTILFFVLFSQAEYLWQAALFLSNIPLHRFKNASNLPQYGTDLAEIPVGNMIFDSTQTAYMIAKLAWQEPGFIIAMPELLGFSGQRTYLLLFQNEYERRGTGGFITAYAVIRISKGKIHLEQSDNIYALDATIKDNQRPPLPRLIGSYLDKVDQFYIRDSNIHPDFTVASKQFDEIYKLSRVKVDYDGIIAMDSQVFLDLLDLLGPTEVDGEYYNTQIDSRCNCPQALYKIWDKVGRRADYYKEDRKSILGSLAKTLMRRSTTPLALPQWSALANMIINNLQNKHILVYAKKSQLQKKFAKLGFTGELTESESDYLHYNTLNFGGVKSNLYVQEAIKSETSFKNNVILRRVEIDYKNPQPHSDCAQERETLCLNAKLRSVVRLYVPQGSQLVQMQGSFTPAKTYDELGKTVFEAVVEVYPEGLAKLTAIYKLPAKFYRDSYSLMLQSQPGIRNQFWQVTVDDKPLYQDNLYRDVLLR